MSSSSSVWLDTIAPLFGGIIASGLNISAIPLVLRIARDKSIGQVDPAPSTFLLCTSIGWLCYAFLMDTPAAYYIYAPNVIGICSNLFAFLVFIGYADEKNKSRIGAILIGFALIFALGAFISVKHFDLEVAKLVVGLIANLGLVMFYVSPISIMIKSYQTKNPSLLYMPMILLSFLNSLMWLGFGIAVNDIMIIAPQVFGIVIGTCQTFLALWFKIVVRPAPTKRILEMTESEKEINQIVPQVVPSQDQEKQ
jgi:uncharacterized protein with PQ loop repeat